MITNLRENVAEAKARRAEGTKHQICGLCGCVRGSCPHDDCQCYLHQVPAEGTKQVESRSFLKRKAAMQGKPIPTFVAEAGEVELQSANFNDEHKAILNRLAEGLERQEFEAWHKREWPMTCLDQGEYEIGYADYNAEQRWIGWQAARAPRPIAPFDPCPVCASMEHKMCPSHQPKPVNSPNITPQQLTSETCPRCLSRGQECAMCRHAREDYEAS